MHRHLSVCLSCCYNTGPHRTHQGSMTNIICQKRKSIITTGIVIPLSIWSTFLLFLTTMESSHISWSAWKITSQGLFWPAWPQKAPPDPAPCTQLIFPVATLLTAPPTDYFRRPLEEDKQREDCWGLLGRPSGCLHALVLVPQDVHHLPFSITTHPVVRCVWTDHFASSLSCLLIKYSTHSTSVVVESRPFAQPTQDQSSSFLCLVFFETSLTLVKDLSGERS